MRIRGTKPEFWRSRTVASVDWHARLVLKGIESYVDDNGVGKDDVALIVSDIFPRDMLANPRETVARVSEAISHLHDAGLLWRYEVDGLPLLYVSSWESIQRVDKPQKGRFPRPDGTMDYRDSEIRESVARPRESVAPVTGEQGNRGTGEQNQLGVPVTTRAPELPTDESPHRCAQHRGVVAPPPCRDCGDMRESSVDHTAAETARRTRERDDAARNARAEIDACDLCGDDGYRLDRIEVCNHRPVDTSTARQRIAEMRATLANKETA